MDNKIVLIILYFVVYIPCFACHLVCDQVRYLCSQVHKKGRA